MDLNKIGLFKLISEKMAWHSQRQGVLAQNVANSDTPDYKPQDLVAFDFRKELRESGRMEIAQTNPMHMAGTLPRDRPFKDGRQRATYETAPDGNAVVLEEQMTKLGQNAIEFQGVTNIYRKQIAMLKTALGRGGQ
ncbi:flagellar basal body rod protein FlgB [Rhodospirillum centenum]|uniref:Flagellar basal body rod protein FlgB n=1 Tax=Rhodospirillum centenum (strain ATCC 51521 / SW) TaxID=414684 RepID=B6IS84_RHOCS|nr:flagellar basal body rod protein FlgB [Rhodospirillum centenum]ACI98320.1 flagellar basal-body rod protein FlgB, putative [Rhodospirillum centenum SW]